MIRGNSHHPLLKVSLILIFLSIAGCESKPKYTAEELAAMPLVQREGLPQASGGFSLSVAGETITADEVVRPLVEPAKPFAQAGNFQAFEEQSRSAVEKVITNKISNILLYKEAKKEAGEQIDDALDKAADAEIRKFITSYGGDYAKAEDALEQMKMDWKSFREEQKKIIMSHSYISSKIKEERPITYGEMLLTYEKVKGELFARQGMIKFSLIDIQPSLIEIADPNKTRLENAKNLAAELTSSLSAGEDFAELAKKYSKDHRSMFGGSWTPVNPDSLAPPYDMLAGEAKKIQVGQIAGPIETEGHIFIMKLEEKQDAGYEPFENVQEQILANITFERRKQAVEKVSEELIQRASVAVTDEFITHCLQRLYLLARQ